MNLINVGLLQWTQLPDMDAMEANLDDSDIACLGALRNVLQNHGKLDRFGITLLHKHFSLHEDECLLEVIDAANRRIHVSVVPRSAIRGAVPTQWNLGSEEPLQFCEYRDRKHMITPPPKH